MALGGSNLELSIRVRASVQEAERALASVRRQIDAVDRGAGAAGRRIDRFGTNLDDIESRARKAAAGLGLIGAAAVAMIRHIAQAADAIAMMRVQMDRLAGSSAGLAKAADLADQLGLRLEDTSRALNFFVPVFEKYGYGFDTATGFVADLTRSLSLFGVRGEGANIVLQQLSQGFDSLQGDELQSLREQAGGLYTALERAVQGILNTRESLKDLGSQGRVTGDVLYRAFEQVFVKLRGEFAALPNTLAAQEARLANAWQGAMSALDRVLFASATWQFLTSKAADYLQDVALNLGQADTVTLGALERRRDAIRRDIAWWQGQTQSALEKWFVGDRLAELKAELMQVTAAIGARQTPAQSKTAPGNAPAAPDPKLTGVNEDLAARWQALLAAATAEGVELGITSGLRSAQKGIALWEQEVRRAGSVAAALAAGNVAPPGTSKHEKGEALDIGGDAAARAWLRANAGRFGLQTYRGPNYGDHLHVTLRDFEKESKDAARAADERAQATERAAAAAQREREAAAGRAEAWRREIDPLRAYQERLREIEDLYRAGALSAGEFAAAQAKVRAELAGEQLRALEEQWQQALERMRAAEQSANIQAEQGLLGVGEAQQAIGNAHREAAASLEALLPKLEAAANAIGPAASARIRQWKNELAQVQTVVDPLAQSLNTAFAGSLENLFTDIALGAKTAKEAFLDFARSILAAIARIAAQQLAAQLLGMFGGGAGGGIGGAIAGFIGGRAGGGYVSGPGTGTSDSIRALLSNGEYVINADAVKRIGVGALDWLNGPGWLPRLDAGRAGFAQGSLSVAPAAATGGNVRIVNTIDPALAAEWIASAAGERVVMNHIARNAAAMRMICG